MYISVYTLSCCVSLLVHLICCCFILVSEMSGFLRRNSFILSFMVMYLKIFHVPITCSSFKQYLMYDFFKTLSRINMKKEIRWSLNHIISNCIYYHTFTFSRLFVYSDTFDYLIVQLLLLYYSKSTAQIQHPSQSSVSVSQDSSSVQVR